MSYLGIGSPIPTLKTLRELEVTLNYPVASACEQDSTVIPSIKEPAGGTFSAPSGLTIDPNTGVITPGSSTAGDYVISYNVSGVVGNFDFEIVADKASGFSYGSSSLEQSGYATPTFDSGVQPGGTFTYSSSTGGTLSIIQNQSSNDNGRIDLSNSDIDTYSISYASPGPCSTTTAVSLEIVAAYVSASSFYFDGINDYFDLNDSNILNGLTDFSVSLWLNPSATQLAYASPFSFRSASAQYLKLNFGATPSNNQLEINFKNNDTAVATSSVDSIPLNNWTNVIVVFDASSSLSLYVNGGLDGQDTTNLPTSVAQSTNIYIGTDAGNTARTFKGYIDEVSIWNTALGTSAITEISNKTTDLTSLTHASSSNLVAWYKMGE